MKVPNHTVAVFLLHCLCNIQQMSLVYLQMEAVKNGQVLSLQQSVRVTNIGRLSDFEHRVDTYTRTHGADAVANAQRTEHQVHQQLLQESVSMSVTPVQSVAPATNVMPLSQELKSNEAMQARMARMQRMSDKGAPTQQPVTGAPVVSKQGGRDVPSTCSACKLPRKDTHNRGGCPTHCLECKEKKDQCSCPLYCLRCGKERWKGRCICPKHCLTCKKKTKQCKCS